MAIRVKLVDKLKAENDQLRDAARQLHAGLLEYAKKENWKQADLYDHEKGQVAEPYNQWIWMGDGDGPKIARYFLGLEQDKN
jgi:hypothetical protein